MLSQIYDLPTVRRSLNIVARVITAAQTIHQAVTSDCAIRIYRATWEVAKTAFFLSVAVALLMVDAIKAFRQWYDNHKDEDFEKLATVKVQAAATVVKVWLKGQRDRASFLIQYTAVDLEMTARAKVSRLGLMISEKAIAQCGVGGCK